MSTTIRKKLVIVGDADCDKTGLLISFTKGEYPDVYVPTVFQNFVKDIKIDDRMIELALWDTSGQEDYWVMVTKKMNYMRLLAHKLSHKMA